MSKKKNIFITFILGISLIMPVPLYAQTTSSQEDGVTINNTPAASVTVEFNKNDNGKKAKSTDSSQLSASDWIEIVDIAYDSSLDFDYIFSQNAEADAYTDVTCWDPFANVQATIANHLLLWKNGHICTRADNTISGPDVRLETSCITYSVTTGDYFSKHVTI